MPVITALGGAAGALVLIRFWRTLAVLSAAVLILSILHTAAILKSAQG
jgi:hypothetical protein